MAILSTESTQLIEMAGKLEDCRKLAQVSWVKSALDTYPLHNIVVPSHKELEKYAKYSLI